MIDWIAGAMELSGAWCVGNKWRIGFICNLLGCIMWVYVAINTHIYGLLLVVIPAIIINIRNYKKWSIKGRITDKNKGNVMKWHIHKWYYINGREYDNFFGKKCPRERAKYRVCIRCGKAQEFYRGLRGGWRTLSDCKAEVLRDKMAEAEKACGRVLVEEGKLVIL
ncbi:MAG: hypothetical protein WC119_01725 [Synergistaceae bacterium]